MSKVSNISNYNVDNISSVYTTWSGKDSQERRSSYFVEHDTETKDRDGKNGYHTTTSKAATETVTTAIEMVKEELTLLPTASMAQTTAQVHLLDVGNKTIQDFEAEKFKTTIEETTEPAVNEIVKGSPDSSSPSGEETLTSITLYITEPAETDTRITTESKAEPDSTVISRIPETSSAKKVSDGMQAAPTAYSKGEPAASKTTSEISYTSESQFIQVTDTVVSSLTYERRKSDLETSLATRIYMDTTKTAEKDHSTSGKVSKVRIGVGIDEGHVQENNNMGAIVGVVMSVGLLLVIAVVVIVWKRRSRAMRLTSASRNVRHNNNGRQTEGLPLYLSRPTDSNVHIGLDHPYHSQDTDSDSDLQSFDFSPDELAMKHISQGMNTMLLSSFKDTDQKDGPVPSSSQQTDKPIAQLEEGHYKTPVIRYRHSSGPPDDESMISTNTKTTEIEDEDPYKTPKTLNINVNK